ncbi:MAG: class I SAM-dependent methyltransferase [Allorhizobium sp.]
MTTALGDKIKDLIRTAGPISVTDYFALCLADPQYGYYQTREPFGTTGDFVTAPEVSQVFGEMLGIFMVNAWQRHGTPDTVRLVEVGPGRGTMMADMLRVAARLAPPLFDSVSVHLVETSPRLQQVQKATLETFDGKIAWHTSFDEVPDGFTLIAANELFDAIPIRQFVKTPTGFRERMVGLDADDGLAFTLGIATLDPAMLPKSARPEPDGTIFELAPARQAVMQTISERLVRFGGSALIIDYGHMVSGFGDTLQAVHAHQYDPPLAHPGMADLTSHVDFENLAATASAAGAYVNGCLRQGDFLLGLGIEDRASRLGRGKDIATQQEIVGALERLVGAGVGRMGELFKVLAISGAPIHLEPFRPVNRPVSRTVA